MSEENKGQSISLENVRVRKEGNATVFMCPLGSKDESGKTPCDYIADYLQGAKEIVTRNVQNDLFDAEFKPNKKEVK